MSSSCACASLPTKAQAEQPNPKLSPSTSRRRQISSPLYPFVCVPRHFWDGNAACRYCSSSAVSRTLTCAAERAFSSIDVESLLIHLADCGPGRSLGSYPFVCHRLRYGPQRSKCQARINGELWSRHSQRWNWRKYIQRRFIYEPYERQVGPPLPLNASLPDSVRSVCSRTSMSQELCSQTEQDKITVA